MNSSLLWASFHISVWSLILSLAVACTVYISMLQYTTVLYARDFHMPLQLKVKINAQLGQFKRNLSLTFPCYLSGHPVSTDELKCTSCPSQQHQTLTTSLQMLYLLVNRWLAAMSMWERMLEWNGRCWQNVFSCLRFNVLSESSLLLLCMQINQRACACQKRPGINKKLFPLCLSFISK